MNVCNILCWYGWYAKLMVKGKDYESSVCASAKVIMTRACFTYLNLFYIIYEYNNVMASHG